jgi:hypothetical protein
MIQWNTAPAMDHRYIDDNLIAARYIDNALSPQDRAAFEQHVVYCPECSDRILLAGMFQTRQPGPAASAEPDPVPFRAKLAARLTPWQLFLIFVASAILLLAIPSLVMFYSR